MRFHPQVYDLIGEEGDAVGHKVVKTNFVPDIETLQIVASSFVRINAPMTIDGVLINDGIMEIN